MNTKSEDFLVFIFDDALFINDLTFKSLEILLSRTDDVLDSMMIGCSIQVVLALSFLHAAFTTITILRYVLEGRHCFKVSCVITSYMQIFIMSFIITHGACKLLLNLSVARCS